MPKFRKKPVVIEAMLFTGTNHGQLWRWMYGCSSESCKDHGRRDDPALTIHTLEGAMTASAGDWIIEGVQGEHYACKPDIFAATYEPVEASDD